MSSLNKSETKYDFEYEVNGKKVIMKDVTLEEINLFVSKLKTEKESSIQFKKTDFEERE